MLTTQLEPEVLAYISRALAVKLQTAGPVILGSQLGKVVNDALAPRHLRDFRGLRAFADLYLARLVRQREYNLSSSDVAYDIIEAPAPAAQPAPVPTEVQSVAGFDLWRFFSNPNINCQLAILDSGVVVAGPTGAPLPPTAVPLARFSSQRYRALAQAFANEHSTDTQVGVALEAALKGDDFYKRWITTLRGLRCESGDLLRKWEILREETVAQALTDALIHAGVDATRVAEVVQLARPFAKPIRAAKPAIGAHVAHTATETPRESTTINHVWSTRSALPMERNETDELRQLLHRAIDVMPLTELREVRLSASTLMKMTTKMPV